MKPVIFGTCLLAQLWAVCGQLTSSSEAIRKPDGPTIAKELRSILSKDARIVLPSTAEGQSLLIRASTPRISPGYAAIVEVTSEADIEKTIQYANKKHTPFLAVSGTHGWPSSLNKIRAGIQINMRKLNHTTLSQDGKSAHIGGGAMQYEITADLFKNNKQAVIGICECVSGIGPLLGGGHSMLQGRYGFAADNLLSARVVLANGTTVEASAAKNKDLFWALRGAGHNFGIVASYDLKVYEVENTWTMTALSFTQDKLEAFFDTWNKLEDEYADPGMLVLNGVMARNNDLDPDHPLLNLQLLYEGDKTAIDAYAAAFRKIGPVADSTTKDIAWGDLFDVGGFGLESSVCRKNQNILGYPNSFDRWRPHLMRKGFEIFDELTSDETFSTAAWLLESYGRQGVRAVSDSENAVAPEERHMHILTSPMLWWKGDDSADKAKAAKYGRRIQKAIRSKCDKPHTYVNYAMGKETKPEVYGHNPQRLRKLKSLKKEFDPRDRFGFYNPI